MSLEIERKFLVCGDFKLSASKHERIIQGYLSSSIQSSVRVRRIGDKAYLTIKGKTNKTGTTRFEWEKEIEVTDAEALLLLCELSIDKIRYYVPVGKLIFEVDEFLGENRGLVIAEIELEDENQAFDKPEWLAEEVTGDDRYYNLALSAHPYSKW